MYTMNPILDIQMDETGRITDRQARAMLNCLMSFNVRDIKKKTYIFIYYKVDTIAT